MAVFVVEVGVGKEVVRYQRGTSFWIINHLTPSITGVCRCLAVVAVTESKWVEC